MTDKKILEDALFLERNGIIAYEASLSQVLDGYQVFRKQNN